MQIDVKIWNHRLRDPIAFQNVISRKMLNDAARKHFSELEASIWNKIKDIATEWFKEHPQKTISREVRGQMKAYVEDVIDLQLLSKEVETLNSWLKQGKVAGKVGATKRKLTEEDYEDAKKLQKTLNQVGRVIHEILGVPKMTYKGFMNDTQLLGFKKALIEAGAEEEEEEEEEL